MLDQHHLWHVDGNHKLFAYHLVVHGGIDGFSRAALFLRCSDNNCAKTVEAGFMSAVHKYGVPSRLRVDKGGENWDIADFMFEARGENRNSVIAGRSIHNQRIERFWRDVRKEVLNFYMDLFEWFTSSDSEENNLLNIDNPTRDVFILLYLFLPRINQDLLRFQERWNLHKIRSENELSPNQLLQIHQEDSGAIPYIDDIGDNNINNNNGRPENLQQVVLEPIKCPLNLEQFEVFSKSISPPISLNLNDRNSFVLIINEALNTYHNICN